MKKAMALGVLVLWCGCGGGGERRERSGETAGSERPASGEVASPPAASAPIQVRSNERPPALSEEMIASDAESPALTVMPETGWVVIPSFRAGLAMPNGWYWSDAEELVRATETTRHHFDDASIADLRRGLQAVVNEYRQDDPSVAGQLIPSARVLLLPGGLPRGARVDATFCTQTVLPQLAAVYPDARVVAQSTLTFLGYPGVRCGVDHTVELVAGYALPGHSETVLVFGESHVIMLAVVGGAERAARTAEILSAMVESARSL
jgi:hypothetical protein